MTKVRQIRAYSRPAALAKLDQRTVEARLMRETRADLEKHVGGTPSAVQQALIEQAAQLRLRLAVMDAKFAETSAQTDHDSRTYLAWSNSYSRLMRLLGMKGPAPKVPTLEDIRAGRA
jgi:phage shock protein A